MNRIKPLLDNIIHPTQMSFIKGRRAANNAIIAHEAMLQLKNLKGKKAKMMIKLDLGKAFDKLELSFISLFLIYLNFPKD